MPCSLEEAWNLQEQPNLIPWNSNTTAISETLYGSEETPSVESGHDNTSSNVGQIEDENTNDYKVIQKKNGHRIEQTYTI